MAAVVEKRGNTYLVLDPEGRPIGQYEKKEPQKPTPAAPIEDGIYFDLDEDAYHNDEALGSSDHRKLLKNPSDYWYESPLNPGRKPERDTPALLRGRAMHKLVLEGKEAFDKLYNRIDHSDDMSPAEKAAATKVAKAQANGRTPLPADVYDRVVLAAAMITENPYLATAFTNGMPEVSIFWTRDGIRRKSRLDYLKPRGVGDLKSIANTRELPFEEACRNNLTDYRYDMQAALYMEARSMIPRFLREGRYTGRTEETGGFLFKCAKEQIYAFQFVFFQSERAPITWSTVLSPANPILELGRRHIDLATDNYKRFMDHFGRNKRWRLEEPPQELDMNELPARYGR